MVCGIEYTNILKLLVNRSLCRLLSVFIMLSGLFACAGFETMSNEVRRGGWVMVALGPTTNESFKPMDITTATFTDVEGTNVVNVVIRELLRVNPDPASLYGAGLESSNGLGANTGQLLAIVQIPNDPSIKVGVGILKLYNPVMNVESEHELRILPDPDGVGAPVNNLYGWDLANGGVSTVTWLNNARPGTHVQIITTPDASFDPLVTVPAGAMFRLTYNTGDFLQTQGATWPQLRVVKKSSDANLQLSWHTQEIGGDVSELIITLSNPHGFYPPDINVAVPEKTHFRDLSTIAIVWDSVNYSGSTSNPFTLDQAATLYFDIEGGTIDFTASMELYEP